MISEKDIEKLFSLSRIESSKEEIESLKKDVGRILDYVKEIEKSSVEVKKNTENHELINVMREDGEPHQGGIYSERILKEAPQKEGDYIAVKNVFND